MWNIFIFMQDGYLFFKYFLKKEIFFMSAGSLRSVNIFRNGNGIMGENWGRPWNPP